MTLPFRLLFYVAIPSLCACQSANTEPSAMDGNSTESCEVEAECHPAAEGSSAPDGGDSGTSDGDEPVSQEPSAPDSPNPSNAPDAGGIITPPPPASGAMVPYLGPGTRLKPTVIVLGSGVDIQDPNTSTWFDSELGVPCTFGYGEDGQLRCIPTSESVWFSDAECTAAGLIWQSAQLCAGPRAYVSGRDQVGTEICSGPLGYRVGEQRSRPTQLYRLSDTGCEPSEPNTLAGDFDLYYELERVPADTFVAIDVTAEPRVPGLDAHTFRGEDGSYQVFGFYDSARGSECSRMRSLQPVDRCIPSAAPVIQYAGPDCTTGAAYATAFEPEPCALNDPPKLLLRSTIDASADSCVVGGDGSYELFEMGEAQEDSVQYYRSPDGVCTETPVESFTKVLEGAPVDLSQLFLLETLELGSGDVHALFDGFAGEPYIPVWAGGPFLDTRTGQQCTPVPFEGGAHYCVPRSFELPIGGPNPRYYGDENCTGQRVQPWSPPHCAAESYLPDGILNGRGDACTPWAVQETLSVIGQAPAGAAYNYIEESGECVPVDLPSTNSVLLLGEPLAADSIFVKLDVERRE